MIYLLKATLNNNNQHYYCYNDINKLINTFKDSSLTFTEDNYRLNGNVLKIGVTDYLTYANAHQIHSVVWECNSAYKVYNVVDYMVQSGYVYYTLKVDLWHSFIQYMDSILNVRVTRSTRDITRLSEHLGYLDNPAKALNNFTSTKLDYTSLLDSSIHIPFANRQYVPIKYLAVVFALKYNTYQSSQGSTSRVQLFGFNLWDLAYDYVLNVDSDTAFNVTDLFNMVVDTISGIYCINRKTGVNTYEDFDASIVGAWIVDSELIELEAQPSGYQTIFVRSKNSYNFTNAGNWSNVLLEPKVVKPMSRVVNPYRTFSVTVNTSHAGSQMMLGTRYNNLNLIKQFGTTSVDIKCIVNSAEIKVIAQQGENEEDITSAFALTLTNIDGNVNEAKRYVERIGQGIGLAGSIGTMVGGAISGNGMAVAGGVISLATQATKVADSLLVRRMGQLSKLGDAYVTYYTPITVQRNPDNLYLLNPYALVEAIDLTTRDELVTRYGLSYDTTISTLASIFNYANAVNPIDTFDYLQAVDMTIDSINIPPNAEDFIRAKLNEGIRVKLLT